MRKEGKRVGCSAHPLAHLIGILLIHIRVMLKLVLAPLSFFWRANPRTPSLFHVPFHSLGQPAVINLRGGKYKGKLYGSKHRESILFFLFHLNLTSLLLSNLHLPQSNRSTYHLVSNFQRIRIPVKACCLQIKRYPPTTR